MALTTQEMAEYYGLAFTDLSDFTPSNDLLSLFPASLLSRENILPISLDTRVCLVATSDPTQLEIIHQLERYSPGPSRWCSPSPNRSKGFSINNSASLAARFMIWSRCLRRITTTCGGRGVFRRSAQASSVIKLVNELISEAISQRASDIHIEPEKNELVVRFRIDGVLYQQNIPAETERFSAAIVSRIKIMAHLNIAEKRLPQDGRFPLHQHGKEIDVRVSVIPSYHGESVVLRLLNGTEQGLSLNSVELPQTIRAEWNNLIRRPHG